MRYLGLIVCFLVSVFLSGCTSGEGYFRQDYDYSNVQKVAVVDVIGPVGGEAARNQIADFFAMELLKKGYSPIERAQVHVLLKEQEFQASAITSSEDAAQAGRILNVPAVLIVNIPKFGEDIQMTAKLVDVEDGSILWMSSGKGKGGKFLGTLIGATAGAIVGYAATGEDDQVLGAVVGGVAGGAAGNLLTPDEAEKMQEIIRKVCETLPSRQIRYQKIKD
jgi:hypothetical protein